MFLMKETLVDLTPDLLRQGKVQGGCIGISTEGFDLKNHTLCPYTSWNTR